jgi:site-specific DNA recombinase
MPSTNGHSPKRAILYARVSTEDQAEEGYSLPEQVRHLERYAEAKGYAILGEPILDDGYSGRTMNRPGLALVRELAAEGAFEILLVAKWNRLFRRGAYQDHFIAEMKLVGVDVISLDGQKNDTPAGKLFNRMMADFSEYQRDDLIDTMQRGKRGRARSGKVLPGRYIPYGFEYDAEMGSYRVNENWMPVVRTVFRMVGVEGRSLHYAKKTLNEQSVPTPAAVLAARERELPSAGAWRHRNIRLIIWNDVYKPHTYEEIAQLVSPEVATTLKPDRLYGVQWYNRNRYERTPDGEKAVHVTPNKREEWIAVPVPDAGIPREWVEAAREAIKDNRRPSANGDRVWELSGGILYCAECGCRMAAHTTKDPKRAKSREYGQEACSHRKFHRAVGLESAVWDAVSEILKNPEQLREDLDRMIELERRDMRRDPDREARLWAEKLVETDRMRRGYQEQAAKGYMSLEELGVALEDLEKTRRTAERELEAFRNQKAPGAVGA